jgi:ATP-binding cassette, subfamily B (MDR/TAP), member 1
MAGPPPKVKPSVLGLEPVPFKRLYSFHTKGEVFLVFVAGIAAAGSGSILPLFSLVFGDSLNVLNDQQADIVSFVNKLALYFLLIAM